MRSTRPLLLVAVLLAASAPAPFAADKADPTAVRKAIEAANAEFTKLFAKGDAAAVAKLYTEDGALFPPGQPILRGRKKIEEFWGGVIKSGVKSATLKTLEVEGLGDTAWESGTVELTASAEGKETKQTAKYVVVWKRSPDGAWKLHRDIWNRVREPKEKAKAKP
jgi:uncharacterized protein (TIGR02246 family)